MIITNGEVYRDIDPSNFNKYKQQGYVEVVVEALNEPKTKEKKTVNKRVKKEESLV